MLALIKPEELSLTNKVGRRERHHGRVLPRGHHDAEGQTARRHLLLLGRGRLLVCKNTKDECQGTKKAAKLDETQTKLTQDQTLVCGNTAPVAILDQTQTQMMLPQTQMMLPCSTTRLFCR